MSVNVWLEDVVIPTYEISKAEKNPIFLEKRVFTAFRTMEIVAGLHVFHLQAMNRAMSRIFRFSS